MREAINIYRTGLRIFPNSLMLRFNFLRTCLHYGSGNEVAEALDLGLNTLKESADCLSIDPEEDCFPYDFYSVLFNYRDYLALVVSESVAEGNLASELKRIVFGSMACYLSNYLDQIELAQHAVKLDGVFPYYQLNLAVKLVESLDPNCAAQAESLLEKLISGSHLLFEAYEVWLTLADRGQLASSRAPEVQRKMLVAKDKLRRIEPETLRGISLQPVDPTWRPPQNRRNSGEKAVTFEELKT